MLRNEALESLRISPQGIYLDGTFGRGGHSSEILRQLDSAGRLLAMDADTQAVEHARESLGVDARFTIRHDNFANLASFCEDEGCAGDVDGVLLDLGVSSPQLDQPERGFSFQHDGPLDMRLDTSAGESAAEWIARAGEADMADVFWRYGEERYSRKIAKAIVQQRTQNPFRTTLSLAESVKAAHPRWERNKHPATRVFQAIRIHINRELEVLASALDAVVEVLKVGGRLVVISFHSLEDRIVKRFARGDHRRVQQPRGLPVPLEQEQWRMRPVGKKITPSAREIEANPRARSAVLRVVEKIA